MTDVHVVEGSFTHPELTARYRPYPTAGRGTVKFTRTSVALEGLEPARGHPWKTGGDEELEIERREPLEALERPQGYPCGSRVRP
jgi:hypothetical protein